MKRFALCLFRDGKTIFDPGSIAGDWLFRFAQSRQAAFEVLPLTTIEAVAIDDPWQDGTGRDFFADLATRCPKLVRVRLFDPSDRKTVLSVDGQADICVPKPCTAAALVSAIERAKLLRTWISEPAMKVLLPRIGKVPSAPPLYSRLMQVLEAAEAQVEDVEKTMREVGKIMGEDAAMTAKLMQMVNSPGIGLKRTITSPAEAVAHLGLVQTKALLLLAHVFSECGAINASRFSLDQLWRHSTATAKLARAITESETKDASRADLTFAGGLLHDVGKLIHAVSCPKEYDSLLTYAEHNEVLYVDLERHLMGTTHAELGACIFAKWSLPVEILEIIAFHHTPTHYIGDGFSPLTAVHVANVFEHEANSASAPFERCHIDHDYLERLGCDTRLSVWRERCARVAMAIAA
jgi:putative nucleotidyltransferase with HDIG domain